jgi:hypothetical protein
MPAMIVSALPFHPESDSLKPAACWRSSEETVPGESMDGPDEWQQTLG